MGLLTTEELKKLLVELCHYANFCDPDSGRRLPLKAAIECKMETREKILRVYSEALKRIGWLEDELVRMQIDTRADIELTEEDLREIDESIHQAIPREDPGIQY